MNNENTGNTDWGPGGKPAEDEREALAQKLSEALEENRLLHDRIAELDISMNIETVELKKDIEALARERDELSKENDFLLEDYTAKDHKMQELLRQIEIKQLMINETSSYLSTATDRIKNLEKQCSNLEAHYAGIPGSNTASGDGSEQVPEHEAVQRTSLLEDIRKEFEDTLGQKELEIETLSRNMEQLKEQNKSLSEEKAGSTKDRQEPPDTPAPLENTLLEMEHSLAGLEQRISRASEIGVTEKEEILMKLDDAQREIFSLREYHRSLLEALRTTDEVARRGVFSLTDYHQSILETLRSKEREHDILKDEASDMLASLREKDETISKLRSGLAEGIQGDYSSRQEAEELDAAARRISHLESELTQERMLRADLEDTMQRKDMILQELHEHFVSETEKQKTETAAAQEAAERAADEARRLEAMVAGTEEAVAALNQQIARQKISAETREREASELAEQTKRLEEERQRLIEAAEEQTSALHNILSLRSQEHEALTRRAEELETELGNAAAELTRQKDLLAARGETPASHEETERLQRANEELSVRLEEALQRAAALEEIKTVVSLEMKNLSEKMELLKNEDMAERAMLKNDIDSSFSRITESTERLNQAINEGLPLARKLEEISSAMGREALPAVYRAAPPEPEKPGGSPLVRQIAVFSGLLLLMLAAAVFFRQDIYQALAEKGLLAAAPKPASWETGTKQAKSGPFEATLTFLNKEAVQVLGFSDIIPDSDLTHNIFALIEIKSTGACIPEDFIASPEKNMSFLDDQGNTTPLHDAGALSGWKKTIYRQNACGKRMAGPVYMKHIISAAKGSSLKGLTVRGLGSEPIILK